MLDTVGTLVWRDVLGFVGPLLLLLGGWVVDCCRCRILLDTVAGVVPGAVRGSAPRSPNPVHVRSLLTTGGTSFGSVSTWYLSRHPLGMPVATTSCKFGVVAHANSAGSVVETSSGN